MTTFKSLSSEETKKFAEALAKKILKRGPAKHAVVLALKGDLGAGKTTFTQGFYKGLGLKTRVTSPTFILMRRTALKRAKFKNVFHLDFYRIHKISEIPITYFQQIIQLPENIILIEWPERAARMMPKNATRINFLHGARENERIIRY